VEDARRRVETEILIGRNARRQPSLGCCPFKRQHVILGLEVRYRQTMTPLVLLPEKLRPKISSSGGSRSLGVVVFVMVSLDGSIF